MARDTFIGSARKQHPCAGCGLLVSRSPSLVKKRVYCTKACFYSNNKAPILTCRQCQGGFKRCVGMPKDKKFCSQACWRANQKARWVQAVCPSCKKDFTDKKYASKRRQRYCSVQCAWDGRPRTYAARSATRLIAAPHIYGSSCLICGFDRAIDYAHIKPACEGGTIHPSNILPLCPNHHRLFDQKKLNELELLKIQHRIMGAPCRNG